MSKKLATILEVIMAHKAQEVAEQKDIQPLADLQRRMDELAAPRGFVMALQQRVQQGKPAVIAEIKKASPSRGVIREAFRPAEHAAQYEAAGACCLSVLTDSHFFQGSAEALQQARQHCALPVLRKDFMMDRYQVYQARAWGADCILLIVAVLEDNALHELADLSLSLGMDVLVEVHDEAEMRCALALPEQVLLGVNNRNLHTFDTCLDTSIRLRDMVPASRLLVAESGVHNRQHVHFLQDAGLHVFLIGEAFMSAADPGRALHALFSETASDI